MLAIPCVGTVEEPPLSELLLIYLPLLDDTDLQEDQVGACACTPAVRYQYCSSGMYVRPEARETEDNTLPLPARRVGWTEQNIVTPPSIEGGWETRIMYIVKGTDMVRRVMLPVRRFEGSSHSEYEASTRQWRRELMDSIAACGITSDGCVKLVSRRRGVTPAS